MTLSTFKPAVPKQWLIAIAGLVWCVTGILLCTIAFTWLTRLDILRSVTLGSLGVIGAVIVYYLLFSRLARKNLQRISHYFDKGCVFAFQAWKSYLIIIFMIALGTTLRHFLFPRDYLAVIYLTMGGALFLSSFLYYANLWRRKQEMQGPH